MSRPLISYPKNAGWILYVLVLWMGFGGNSGSFAAEPTHSPNAPFTSDDATSVIDDIQVIINDRPHRQATYAQMARRLIRQKPGATITDAGIRASVEALTLSRRFSAIHVDTTDSHQGQTLVFTLTPYHYIKDIRIRGNPPLFDQDVLNAMTLYPGDPYARDQLPAQAVAIGNRYKREGYIDPQVSIEAIGQDDDEKETLVVNIHKGPAYRLGTLRFDGRRAISEFTLKRHMHVWWATLLPGGGRFSSYHLKQDADALLALYRKKGFVDATLSYATRMADGRHVDVTFTINEGKRTRVNMVGNHRFWNLTLKKDIVLFRDGNRNNIGVRRSIRNMKRRYRDAGFLDARIKAEILPSDDASENRQYIRFTIQEGPETLVESLDVSGNQALATKEIKKAVLTRPPGLLHDGAFVPETLEEDVFSVTTLYMQNGFQNRQVSPQLAYNADKSRVAVELAVNEGPRTMVRTIAINGLKGTGLSTGDAQKVLVHRVGAPFRQPALQAEKEAIASLVAEKGYPHATVDAQVAFSEDRSRADIVHRITPGPKVFLGEIFIAGNLRTDEGVIRRELGAQPGDPLALRTLYDGQRRLRDLDIFQSVNYRTLGLKERDEMVNLFVDIREKAPYYTEFGLGYESDSGLYGRASGGDRNFWGINKALSASGEISQTGYRVETRLTDPRFLGTRTTASLGIYNEEETEFNQTFGTRTTGGSLAFSRSWGAHLLSALNFSLERRDQFNVEDRVTDEANESTRTDFVITPSLRYDTRDSFVRPREGVFSSFSVDISKGLDEDADNFVRYQIDNRIYRTPFEGITVAGLVRIGQVIAYGENGDVPDDQLFFLGGIQDVRGYGENLLRIDEEGDPVGGKTAMVGSLEVRVDLGMNLELTTFFDIGSVQDALVEAGSDSFRSSVGLGLRYITPIGPMGLLYGHKLNREEGEADGYWHISIGYSF
ncbi:hypothetical protein DSCO28_51260 [Desulfosarcina ovata subsp. sediminis]|uniref:Outer membrane protein assembly factor BamA n=1 Tax=Desulfosarcina ovata subsp. sediminis TaxID=885957 RepID=A0A5K7ZWS6_9BACT|nr:hypothetical protein DSCO28_51260 [Desulfosarcina ovata subsp. sediminis]